MRFASVVALIGLCAANFAFAADRDWVHYADFVKRAYIDRFYAAPAAERDALIGRVRIKADGEMQEPLELRIPTASGVTVLHADESGAFDFPYTDELLRADPMLRVNLPVGMKGSATVDVQPRLAMKETYSLPELIKPLDQANALIRNHAGMMRFLIPTLKRVVFKFPPGADASVKVVGATESVVRADKTGRVFVPIDDAIRKSGTQVVCSQVPIWVDLDS